MKYWNDIVLEKIKSEKQFEKLNQYMCEIEPFNLYMGCCYEAASFIIPKDYTIIDLGCYMAAQSFLFEEYDGYIGVDVYDRYDKDVPERFESKNSTHYSMDIEDFLKYITLFKDPDKYYVIMNAVPERYTYTDDRSLLDKIYAKFPNTIVAYPGLSTEVRGAFSEDMAHFTELIENSRCPYTNYYLKNHPDEAKKWKAAEEEMFKEIESYILNKEESRVMSFDEDLDR